MTRGGTFIVFEGGDGVGKTTQVERLCGWLEGQGREVVRTFEPGDTPIGRRLRELVLDPAGGDVSSRAEALLYAADKAQHVHEVVRPALLRGAVVVCDRYVDSMIAYQGAGRVLDLDEITRLSWWAADGLVPDLTVLLDVDIALAVGRKTDRDRLEAAGDDFHDRVREHFRCLAEQDPARYLVLEGRRGIDQIARTIADRVAVLLADS